MEKHYVSHPHSYASRFTDRPDADRRRDRLHRLLGPAVDLQLATVIWGHRRVPAGNHQAPQDGLQSHGVLQQVRSSNENRIRPESLNVEKLRRHSLPVYPHGLATHFAVMN